MQPTAQRIYYLSLVIVFLIGGLTILQPMPGLLPLVSDDAFYYQVIARNIAQGKGVTFDGISLTNGFHPVYLAILVPIQAWFGQNPDLAVRIALFINLGLLIASSLVLKRLCEKVFNPPLGSLAGAALLLNPWALMIMLNGVESGIYLFFLLLTFLAYADLRRIALSGPLYKNPGFYKFILAYGLTILSRTEAVLLLPCLAVDLCRAIPLPSNRANLLELVKKWAPVSLLFLLGLGLVLSPWIVWNLSTFGTVLQSSGATLYYHTHWNTAYTDAHFWQVLAASTKFILMRAALFAFQVISLFIPLFILSLVLPHKYRLSTLVKAFHPNGLFFTTSLYVLSVLGFYAFYLWRNQTWYFTALLPCSAICFAVLGGWFIRANETGTPKNRSSPYIFLGLYLLFTWLIGLVYWQGVGYGRYPAISDGYRIAAWLRHNTPADARVATWSSGLIHYYSDRTVINLDGVVNNEILPYLRARNAYLYDVDALLGYLQSRQVTYITDLDVLPLTYKPATKDQIFETIFSLPSSNNPEQNLEIWSIQNYPYDQ